MEESFLLEDAVDVGRVSETESLFFATLQQNDRFLLSRFPEFGDESVSVLIEKCQRDFQALLGDGEETVARISAGHDAVVLNLIEKNEKM